MDETRQTAPRRFSPVAPCPEPLPRESRIGTAVMVDSLGNAGGGERLAVENAIALDPARYSVHFVITRWDPDDHAEPATRELLARLDEAGIPVMRIERDSFTSIRAWRPLWRLLRSGRIEILHSHKFGSNFWASILGRLAGVPVVIAHEHMWAYDGSSRVRPLIDRHVVARLSHAFVSVSEAGARGMVERENLDYCDVTLIPNGVKPLPAASGADVRRELGIPESARLAVSVGHLRPVKDFPTLLRAVARVRADGVDLHCLIAGEGIERDGLGTLAHDLGIAKAIHMPGVRDDIPDILSAADLAICSSSSEGGPLSVMEYMQARVPVIATAVGGIPELIEDGRDGLLVPAGDPAAVAAAVRELIVFPDYAETLAESAAGRVESERSIATWLARLETLYGRLLPDPRSAPAAPAPSSSSPSPAAAPAEMLSRT